ARRRNRRRGGSRRRGGGRRGARRLGRLRRGLGVVVGNDASDGGENLLHRGLLRLRRLTHALRSRSKRCTSAGGASGAPNARAESNRRRIPVIRQSGAAAAESNPGTGTKLWTAAGAPRRAAASASRACACRPRRRAPAR